MSAPVPQIELSLIGGFLLGAASGLLATLVMDVAMRRLPEGTTPPFVAAGVLSDEPLDATPPRVATVVHYAAGVLSGQVLAVLALAVEGAADLPFLQALAVAAVMQLPAMVVFFSYVVVPVYGRVPSARVARIRRDWALSATVYVVAVTVLVAGPTLVV